MKLLLDTHILLWAAGELGKISKAVRLLLTDSGNRLFFSGASIWEIVIKLQLGRKDFRVDPRRLRKMLIVHGYTELPVTSEHVLRIEQLPVLHKDPFDRMLIAQARTEGMSLVTADRAVAKYKDPIVFMK